MTAPARTRPAASRILAPREDSRTRKGPDNERTWLLAARSGAACNQEDGCGHGRGGGFTLIELLIVISIIGVLAAVLIPQLIGVKKAAGEKSTEADMLQLETGVKTFTRKQGVTPPDNLEPLEGKATWKPDNGTNTGIESLVWFLSQSRTDGTELSGLSGEMTNTDNDSHGVEMPLLHTKDRLEAADAWKTPIAYFGKLGMDKVQRMQPAADADVEQVKCKRGTDGRPQGTGQYQFISAGPDMKFGTSDDLVWPPD